MADTVCILSNATTGVKRNSKKKKEQLNVRKGELVIEIPKKDQIAQHEGDPLHNYRLLRSPNVSFYDSGINIIPLQGPEADYLEGIADPTARILEYRKEQRLQWILNLRSGDMVFFKLEKDRSSKVPLHSKGIIRYYGAVEGRNGVAFGIEIMDPEHKGKGNTNGHPYFTCNHNDGVFLSMYEIIKAVEEPLSSGDRTDPGKKAITQEPTGGPPANNTRSKIGEGGDHQDEPHEPVPVVSSDTFFLNDRVVVQNVKGKAIPGTVRWVGPMIAAGKVVVPVVIGIETDRPVHLKKEFPDTHLGMTGSHGQQLFDLERGKDHGRLFLPEPLVLHAEQYAKQKQEESTFEAQEAKKWGMSLDEYNEQMQKIAETESKKESQIKGNNQQEETNAAGVGAHALDDPVYRMQHQQRQEDLERQRKTRELENTPEDDNFESHAGQNRPREQQPSSLPSPRTADHNNTSSPNHNCFHRSHNDQHSGYPPRQDQYNPNNHYPPANQHHDQYGNQHMGYQQQDHPTYDQHRTPPPPSHRSDYHDRQQFDDGSNPVPFGQQLQEYSLTHSGSSASAHDPSQFTKGTLVKVQAFNGQCLTGTIQWIGTLLHHEGLYAGVELDQVLHGCSDGIFQGRRFFTCPSGMGLFCLLSALQLDGRYMEPNQVPAAQRQDMKNPIQTSQHDDSDIPGGPELFSRYIGDKHGIQGHYNSCYLDATVFGLFALSDSFDMMLLEEPKSEIGQKIKQILWKGIVNPLRRFGVARFESIMELRNELENLGRMKGANKDEKDPEEFLNLLFKEILHVDPFISIKRPFGVEKEFFVQLFLEIEQDQTAPPSSEKLIRKMFHEQNISFTTVPSKLLLQMPRFGKEFKMFSKIIPALEMNVEPLLDPASRSAQKCIICLGTTTATLSCSKCIEVFKTEESLVYFCDTCCSTVHKNRPGHTCEKYETTAMGDVTKICEMQLLSVICIETSHYVCFTRTKDRWLFHDSMANRLYDTYNIPRVTDVSEELNHWVYTPQNQKKLLQASPRDIPECVRRFTQDIYMCVYINPDLDRYGLPLPMEDPSHEGKPIPAPRYKDLNK